MLVCSATQAFALSLLERTGFGCDGATPTTSDVVGGRHFGM